MIRKTPARPPKKNTEKVAAEFVAALEKAMVMAELLGLVKAHIALTNTLLKR